MALGSGQEAAALYASVGVDIGNAITSLGRVDAAFDATAKSAQRAATAANRYSVESEAWAADFEAVASGAAEASVNIDRLARRREMPIADADRLRAQLDRIAAEANQAGIEMAELARRGKEVDPARSRQLADQLQRLEQESRGATAQMQKLDRSMDGVNANGGRMKSVFQGIGLAAGALGFTGIIAGITGMVRSMIGGAAQLEQFKVRFEIMLGSAEKASQRIAELREFGKTTPFELPDIIAASSTLEVFTQGVLSAGEGLRMVGDVAAGTGQNISEIAMWFGRLYDAMKSGQPFGEALMRLQEMGALGGDARRRIEELAKSVKSGAMTMDAAWKEAGGEFSRFAGMMDQQSKTLGGQWSNLMDAIGIGLTNLGNEIMPLAKQAIPEMIKSFERLLDAARPFVSVVATQLMTTLEHLPEVIMAVSVAMGVKLVASLKLAATEGKLLSVVLKSAWATALIGLPLVLEGVDRLQKSIADLLYGIGKTESQTLAFRKMQEAISDPVVAEKLVEMGVKAEDFARLMEAGSFDAVSALLYLRDSGGRSIDELVGHLNSMGELGPSSIAYMASGIRDGAGAITDATKTGVTDPLAAEIRAARQAARAEAYLIPGEIAAAIIEGRDAVLVAGTALANAALDPLVQEARITEIRAQLKELTTVTAEETTALAAMTAEEKAKTIAADKLKYETLLIQLASYLQRANPASKEAAQLLAKYAESEEPATMAAWNQYLGAIEQRTEVLTGNIEAEAEKWGIAPEEAIRRHVEGTNAEAIRLGKAAQEGMRFDGYEPGATGAASFTRGITSTLRGGRSLQDVHLAIDAIRGGFKFDAYSGGQSSAQSFINGLRATITARRSIQDVHLALAELKTRTIGSSLPTAGPFSHPESGAYSIVDAFIGAIGDRLASSGLGGQGLGFSLAGAAPAGGAFAAGSSGGTVEYHNHFDPKIEIDGDVRARDTDELTDALARLNSLSQNVPVAPS